MSHTILQSVIRLHHRCVTDASSWCDFLHMNARRNIDMFVACGFHYSRNNIINGTVATIHYLEYHLASLVPIQSIIFIGIYKTGIHYL